MWKSSSVIANELGIPMYSVSHIAERYFLNVKRIGGRVTLYDPDEFSAYLALKKLGFKKGRATDYMSPCDCGHIKAYYANETICPHCGFHET